MRRLDRLRRLPAAERRVLVEAWAVLLVLVLAARILPLPRLLGLARALARRPARGAPLPAERLAWATEVASRYVPGSTCLTRALAAGLLLRRRRLPATLHIGVQRRGDRLAGHAWLDVDGRVLVGQALEPWEPIFSGSLG